MIKQRTLLAALISLMPLMAISAGETKLQATADIWLSDANPSERDSSAGKFSRFKLKSIQEMGAFRFDASAIKGKEVKSAKLFLKLAGKEMMRYIRVSTVSQTWKEGTGGKPYAPASGATFNFADADTKKAWSFPGSQFADVIMGSGNTITTYDQLHLPRKNRAKRSAPPRRWRDGHHAP